ncbi:MAG: TerB N-terminal domain-containing protein [Oscillospiraceae bacterium]|nr:TerB N-terminal domain-containing protein [Oscillospiraceae bacterium]
MAKNLMPDKSPQPEKLRLLRGIIENIESGTVKHNANGYVEFSDEDVDLLDNMSDDVFDLLDDLSDDDVDLLDDMSDDVFDLLVDLSDDDFDLLINLPEDVVHLLANMSQDDFDLLGELFDDDCELLADWINDESIDGNMSNDDILRAFDDPFAYVQLPSFFDGLLPPISELRADESIPERKRDPDPIRLRFLDMWETRGDSPYYHSVYEPSVFYNQALFMLDFEDDYDGVASCDFSYPVLMTLTYEQLRTYYTWRTRVRRGEVAPVDTAYAQLYCFELINNIGTDSPQDGFDKLFWLWTEYRRHSPGLDKLMPRWLTDYYAMYSPKGSFVDFAAKNGMQSMLPEMFIDCGEPVGCFEAYSTISKYNVRKSKYFTDATAAKYRECFLQVITNLQAACKASGSVFESFIYRVTDLWSHSSVFKNVPLHRRLKQPNRKIEITRLVRYQFQRSILMKAETFLMQTAKPLVTYLMKATEVALRRSDKFSSRLTADVNMLDKETVSIFKSMNIALPELVERSVAEVLAQINHTAVDVDFGNLERIRREALGTQEKLSVDESVPGSDSPTSAVAPSPTPASAVAPSPTPTSAVAPSPTPTGAAAPSSGWDALRDALTSDERAALRAALTGTFNAFIAQRKLMPEPLVDALNAKAVDSVGDTIIEFDGLELTIYDDYFTALEGIAKDG